jgi:hypothetical protein
MLFRYFGKESVREWEKDIGTLIWKRRWKQEFI